MPIPELQDHEPVSSPLHLVDARAADDRAPALFYPRAVAHFLDVCVVAGVSLYVARLSTVLLLGLHSRTIALAGKAAGAAFREAYEYSGAQLLSAAFAAVAVVYFVGLPLVFGRTPGMGVVGLRFAGPLHVRSLALRLAGCALGYATAGLVFITGLRRRNGRFLHDELSGTRIERE